MSTRLKVGIIAPCPPPYGGIVRMVENHLALWPKDEVEAHLIPFATPPDSEPIDGAIFHRLTDEGKRSWKGFWQIARALVRVPASRPQSLLDFARYCRALSRFVQDRNIDVLYTHEVWPAGLSGVIQTATHGIPTVAVTYGETYGVTAAHRRADRAGRFVCSNSNHVISTSEHCRRGAIELGAKESNSSVIYAGVDMSKYHLGLNGSDWRGRYGVADDAVVVSILGHVTRLKLQTFLEALPHMTRHRNLVFVIGGTGENEEYVRSFVGELTGVEVKVVGFVPEDDLPEFYAASDVLMVAPSSQLECMGQSMKEAMACGTAVVGARIGGIPEAIEHGVNGLLYSADDPVALAEAVGSLAEDAGLRKRLGEAGHETAAAKFDARVSARQTLEVLRSVV